MLKINSNLINTNLNSFKIEFKLHRLVSKSDTEIDVDQLFTFLMLKQANFRNIYYLLGINTDGYLSLKKIELNQNLDRKSKYSDLNLKTIWTLNNEKINLNSFSTSGTSSIGLRLNENLVELSINETFVSRYEVVSNQRNNRTIINFEFEIESLNFLFLNNLNGTRGNYHYLIYDLKINENVYLFKRDSNQINLVILDEKLNYLTNLSNINSNNLILFNKTTSFSNDFGLIKELNLKENNFLCNFDFNEKHLFNNKNENYDILNNNESQSQNSNLSSNFFYQLIYT